MYPLQQYKYFLMPPTPSRAKSKRAGPGLLRRRLVLLFFFVVLSAFLAVNVFHQPRTGVCRTSSILPQIGLCPAIVAAVWDLFYHLGGNGPWIPRGDGLGYSNTSIPEDCSVDQVHMVRALDFQSARLHGADTDSCRAMRNDIPRGMPVQDIFNFWIGYMVPTSPSRGRFPFSKHGRISPTLMARPSRT